MVENVKLAADQQLSRHYRAVKCITRRSRERSRGRPRETGRVGHAVSTTVKRQLISPNGALMRADFEFAAKCSVEKRCLPSARRIITSYSPDHARRSEFRGCSEPREREQDTSNTISPAIPKIENKISNPRRHPRRPLAAAEHPEFHGEKRRTDHHYRAGGIQTAPVAASIRQRSRRINERFPGRFASRRLPGNAARPRWTITISPLALRINLTAARATIQQAVVSHSFNIILHFTIRVGTVKIQGARIRTNRTLDPQE